MIFVTPYTNRRRFRFGMRTFLVLLNLRATSSSDLGETKSKGDITEQLWPSYDEKLLVEDEIEIVIQVNGRCAIVTDRHDLATLPFLESRSQSRLRREFHRNSAIIVVISPLLFSSPKLRDRCGAKG